MKKTTKKLVLAKETVRLMNSDRLKEAAGAAPTNFITCGVSCHYFETCFCD